MKEEIKHESGFKTINEMWAGSASEFHDKKVICYKKSDSGDYIPVTYSQLELEIKTFGKGLIEIGLGEHEGVAVISENCIRWMISDLAVLGNKAFNIPRGTSSSDEEIKYIMKHAEAKMAIVEDKKQLERVLKMRNELPNIDSIIVLDEQFNEVKEDEKIYSFNYIHELGKKAPKETENEFLRRRNETSSTDIATIMYTSGTSGVPKGVPLRHSNIMHNVEYLPLIQKLKPSSKFLSILPVWHIFERSIEYAILRIGGSLWYTKPISLLNDFSMVNPTYMASVPRIWIMIYNGVMKHLRRSGKEKLFLKFYNHSLKVVYADRYKKKRNYVLIGEEPEKPKASFSDLIFHYLGNRLIYSKIKKKLGTEFIAAFSGGGSLPEYIDDFFESIGVTLIEGYGLTETSPVLCMRSFDHCVPYTVGLPLPETGLKILDIDGNEVKGSEKGEIWVSGPQVMEGYYKNPGETEKVTKRDDKNRLWFNTGDLGRNTAHGDITVVGRAKDTIVLIGGENIEPTPLEDVLLTSDYIDQVMVCGQDQEYLSALIVPSMDLLEKECEKLRIEFDEKNVSKLIQNSELKKIYMNIIQDIISKEKGYKEIELIHNIVFTAPFTPENGTLTNTLKTKRNKVEERDEGLIRLMYPHYQERGTRKK